MYCKTEPEVKAAFVLRGGESVQDTAAILEMGAMHLDALRQVFAEESVKDEASS